MPERVCWFNSSPLQFLQGKYLTLADTISNGSRKITCDTLRDTLFSGRRNKRIKGLLSVRHVYDDGTLYRVVLRVKCHLA